MSQILRDARLELSNELGFSISHRDLAKAAGIGHATYSLYEQGHSLSDRALARICKVYAHRPDLVDALRAAHNRARDKDAESIFLYLSRSGRVDLAFQIEEWTHDIRKACNDGHIELAQHMARALWPVARQGVKEFAVAHEFALQVARAQSQASLHHLALRTLGDLATLARSGKVDPLLFCELELSRTAISNRQFGFRGVIAADMYAEVSDQIRGHAGRIPSGRWRALWSNVYRSRIHGLTDSLGCDGNGYVSQLCREFEVGLKAPVNEYEDRANRLVLARIHGLQSRFDESMEALADYDSTAKTPADRALADRTRAICLFRGGHREQALSLVDESIYRSDSETYKDHAFRVLKNEMQLRMNVEPRAKKP